MKSVSRTAVLALSAAFCCAAGSSLADKLATPAIETPARGLAGTAYPLRPQASMATVGTALHTAAAPELAASTAVRTGVPQLARVAAKRQTYHDGSYTGPAMDAYYGMLRVRVDVQGGRISAIHVLEYPSDNPTSRNINSQALPMLESEVIQAQNVFVYMISGATLSSNAFLRSTYYALQQAHA